MFRKYVGLIAVLILVGCGVQVMPSDSVDPTAVVEVQPKLSILMDGLQNPVGIDLLPDGGILIAEEGSGERDDSAGVMLIAADGTAGRLISGLPSGRDAGDLSGVPFVKVSPDGKMIYLSHFNLGHLLTLPTAAALTVPEFPFNLADLGNTMLPFNAVQLANPFDLTFDADGVPVVSDATENGVAKQTDDERTRFFHRFDSLPNTVKESDRIDAVPTGIERVGDEYLVTLTGGCPYPAGSGQLVAIDEERNQRVVRDGLNMPIDVTVAPDGTIWVLEFARFDPEGSCFGGTDYLPNTGRLSKLIDDELQVVLTELDFPGSVRFADDGAALISEVFAGRVLRAENLMQVNSPLSVKDVLHKVSAEISLIPTPAPEPTRPPSPTSVYFEDRAAELGLDFQHGAFATGLSMDPIGMMGAGLCWIDYDNDGWLDLYMVNSHALAERDYWEAQGGLPTNTLYRNQDGQFSDVSAASGSDLAIRGNGCVSADFNLDGWHDLYITADGPNALLWNNGDGTFSEGAAAAGVDSAEWNTATAVTDLNGDGLPDMFVAAYIDLENKVEKPVGAFPQDFYGLPDHLFVNNGDGTFTDVIVEMEMVREERGLGAIFTDLDLDGDVELYIANDGHPNRMYSAELDDSELGFTMVDLSLSADTGDSGSGMGVTSGDYNGDGLFDLFVTNWDTELNALYRNEGGSDDNLLFRYSTFGVGISGLGNNVTAWGTTWADFDHDTDEDLFVVHGHVPISNPIEDAQLVRFYGNRLAEGKPNQWRDWTPSVGLGRDQLGVLMARGSASADFDNDGDLDVAINTISGKMVLLVNTSENGNWLQVKLDGFAPNAVATLILADGRTLSRELHVGSSYLASEDQRLHFGLAEFEQVETLTVRWGQDQTVTFKNLASNQLITIVAGEPR